MKWIALFPSLWLAIAHARLSRFPNVQRAIEWELTQRAIERDWARGVEADLGINSKGGRA